MILVYLYSTKRHKTPIKLSESHILLLRSIDSLGFLNYNQLNMIWSVILKSPSIFSKSTLSSWTSYDGLLKCVPKSKAKSLSSVKRSVYVLTPSSKKWLAANGFIDHSDDIPHINSHNEQAIETVVQGVYAAAFKFRELGSSHAIYQSFVDHSNIAFDYISSVINRCQIIGRTKVPLTERKSEVPKMSVEIGANNGRKVLPQSVSNLLSSIDSYVEISHLSNVTINTSIALYSYLIPLLLVEGILNKDDINTLLGYFSIKLSKNGTSIHLNNTSQLTNIDSFIFSSSTTKGKDDKESLSRSSLHRNTFSKLVADTVGKNILSSNPYYWHLLLVHSTLLPNSFIAYSPLAIKMISCMIQNNFNMLLTIVQYSFNRSFKSLSSIYLLKGNVLTSYPLSKLKARSPYILKHRIRSAGRERNYASNMFDIYLKYYLNRFDVSLNDDLINYQDNLDSLLTEKGSNKEPSSNYEVSSSNTINNAPSSQSLFDVNLDTWVRYSYQHWSFTIVIKLANNTSLFGVSLDTPYSSLSVDQKCILLIAGLINACINKAYDNSSPLYQPQESNIIDNQRINKLDIFSKEILYNSRFNFKDIDLRSFNRQFGYSFGDVKSLPFIADMMLSFYGNINQRKHEIFVELDNRTEGNSTQIQKILNYIWYALDHPKKDISMIISITDGSLSSKRVENYTNIGRKLGNLASKFIHSYIRDADDKKIYLLSLYNKATNLKIYLSGVSESYLDISQALLGSNFTSSNLLSLNTIVSQLNIHTEWKVQFKPNESFKALQSDPELMFLSELDIRKSVSNRESKGIYRFMPSSITNNNYIGDLSFKQGTVSNSQAVLFCQEHSLDSIAATYRLYSEKNNFSFFNLFSYRTSYFTAISLPEYSKKYSYLDFFVPVLPYYFQPRTYSDISLMYELRLLTIQYCKDIFNYFRKGSINKAAANNNVKYSSHIFKLLLPNEDLPRPYSVLHQLALDFDNAEDFASQLRLDEIPFDLYSHLLKRWPQGMYNLPRFIPLGYIKNPLLWDVLKPSDSYIFTDFIHPLNSTIPLSRSKIQWNI